MAASPTRQSEAAPLILLGLLCLPLVFSIPRGEYLWTDVLEIGDHAFIATSVSDLFSALVKGIGGHYYRPTVVVLNSLDFAIFGDWPAAFRATNLAIHVANVFLTYALTKRIGGLPPTALGVAALFAVHPLAVTPMAWVSDRTDLIALASSLTFFLFVRRYVATRRSAFLAYGAVVLVVGMGAKESVAATLLVSGVCFLFAPSDGRRPLRNTMVVQSLVIAAWLFWRSHVATDTVRRIDQLDVLHRIALAVYIHSQYLYQLLIPSSLRVCDATRLPPTQLPWIVAGAIGLLALGVVARRALTSRNYLLAFGLLWSVAFIAPTSGVVALKHVRADRYLYCALPGIILVFYSATRMIVGRLKPSARQASACALLIGCYLYFVFSMSIRARRFVTDESLWTYETLSTDGCLEGYSYLARAALLQHRPEDALTYITRALQPAPDVVAYADTSTGVYYRGLILLERGDRAAAIVAFENGVRNSTVNQVVRAESAYELAVIALEDGHYQEALASMHIATDLGPSLRSKSDIFLLSSYALGRLGRFRECREALQRFDAIGIVASTPTRERLVADIRAMLTRADTD